jgi:pimeloyl-ACP methyl ester carboxylesterase
MLLVHGVTSDSGTWWRIGPAIAATGRRVIAMDLPGHGRTTRWRGRHRFSETAEDVRDLIDALGLERTGVAILAHSWGARVAAALPAAGVAPRPLILLDPPALTLAELEAMTHDPEEAPLRAVADAIPLLRAAHPDWSDGDVLAKAESLALYDREAVRAILLGNGAWDAGLEQLRQPSSAAVDVWLLRGDPTSGSLTRDDLLSAFQERLGPDHLVTIRGAGHGPHRTHPVETVAAVRRALGDDAARLL